MKTDPQARCSICKATYSEVVQGGREYFIPWGPFSLCDKCHRLAIMEASQAEFKPLFESPQ